ncbi:MAG: bifunctional riboflavin kinase/FMN adenylyltransferase, partial [Hyphomicrobiales bacterium]|nr:bifunctional riboflavin kinase/FMN adenylyltransferase [Hyphomicrobiales bacterium]
GGQRLGRTLGFPTANLVPPPTFRLKHGIYAVRATFDGATHGGVASFGRRPTFGGGEPWLETYVFDFAGDLYGKTIEVAFVERLRGEEKFPDEAALVTQMKRDEAAARAALARCG